MLIWAMAYAAKNRVNCRQQVVEREVKRATEIPIDVFVPSEQTFDSIRQRMGIIVQRILCQHMPHFEEHYADTVIQHIHHEHSDESAKKSELVCVMY